MNEKEARENVKKQLEGIKKANECGLATKGEFNRDIEAIETVLNLLEKKDRTIQQLKDENRTLNRQAQQYFEQGIKKDKMIDELEDIFYNYQLCEYELTDCTYRKCEYIADDENPPCKECIKQYFESKVREDYEDN